MGVAQSESRRISELLAKNACEAERVANERTACESRVQAARTALNEIGFDPAEYDRLQSQLRVCYHYYYYKLLLLMNRKQRTATMNHVVPAKRRRANSVPISTSPTVILNLALIARV